MNNAAIAPRYLVVSVGFDTIAGDPEDGFCLTPEGLASVAQKIAGLKLPVVLIQGGWLPSGRAGPKRSCLSADFFPGGRGAAS